MRYLFVLLLLVALTLDLPACGGGSGGGQAGASAAGQRNGLLSRIRNRRHKGASASSAALYANSVTTTAYAAPARTVTLATVTPTVVTPVIVPAQAPATVPACTVQYRAVPCPSCPGGVRYVPVAGRAPARLPKAATMQSSAGPCRCTEGGVCICGPGCVCGLRTAAR